MVIYVNGEKRELARACTIAALLRDFCIKPQGVVVERNRSVVSAESFGTVQIEDQDQIEIVRFVGGG